MPQYHIAKEVLTMAYRADLSNYRLRSFSLLLFAVFFLISREASSTALSNPPRLFFNMTAPGATHAPVTIVVYSEQSIELLSAATSDATVFPIILNPTPTNIGGSSVAKFAVGFSPTQPQEYHDVLEIKCSDDTNLLIPLEGQGACLPNVDCDPQSVTCALLDSTETWREFLLPDFHRDVLPVIRNFTSKHLSSGNSRVSRGAECDCRSVEVPSYTHPISIFWQILGFASVFGNPNDYGLCCAPDAHFCRRAAIKSKATFHWEGLAFKLDTGNKLGTTRVEINFPDMLCGDVVVRGEMLEFQFEQPNSPRLKVAFEENGATVALEENVSCVGIDLSGSTIKFVNPSGGYHAIKIKDPLFP